MGQCGGGGRHVVADKVEGELGGLVAVADVFESQLAGGHVVCGGWVRERPRGRGVGE